MKKHVLSSLLAWRTYVNGKVVVSTIADNENDDVVVKYKILIAILSLILVQYEIGLKLTLKFKLKGLNVKLR